MVTLLSVIGVIGGVIILSALWVLSLRRIVPTNEVHIIQRGSETISFGKGSNESRGNVYYEFPSWIFLNQLIFQHYHNLLKYFLFHFRFHQYLMFH